MDVSEHSGFSPQIIHLNRGFPLQRIHLGVPLFVETPIYNIVKWNTVPQSEKKT